MKHVTTLSFVLTIIVAVIAAVFTTNRQRSDKQIQRLLNSSSITDNLFAMGQLEKIPFDRLLTYLEPVLGKQNDASAAAQSLLVSRAFKENRLHDLDPDAIEGDLYSSAMWWASYDNRQIKQLNDTQKFQRIAIDAQASPWIRRLAVLRCNNITNSTLEDLISMAPHDRDGSVLLTVLAIDQHLPQEMFTPLIERWSNSYDLELQSAAILLAACAGHPIPTVPTSSDLLATIRTICIEEHTALAWRSLHREDGTINPDVALAGLIVDRDRFLPIVISTARAGFWSHPEHPVELARRFAPHVSELLPTTMLDQEGSRNKWWSLFACGLLKEQR